MEAIFLLLVIVGFIGSFASKKNMQKSMQKRMPDELQQAKEAAPKGKAVPAAKPAVPRVSPPVAPRVAPTKLKTPAYGGTPKYTHIVTSTLEGGHSHTESSMTGEEVCPPTNADKAADAILKPQTSNPVFPLLLSSDNVVQGLLFAEIMGKPKAMR